MNRISPLTARLCQAFMVAALAVLVTASSGCVAFRPPISPAPRVDPTSMSEAEADRAIRNLRVFDAVWQKLDEEYFDQTFNGLDWDAEARIHGPRAAAASDESTLYAEINALLSKLDDPHTVAVEPARTREVRTGEQPAVGLRLQRMDESWVVADVAPGSMAEEAGVRRGWIALRRNGVELGEAFPTFHQEEGEIVRWEFVDLDNQPVILDLGVRAVGFSQRAVRELAGGLIYLRYDIFDLGNTRWLSQQLAAHRDAPGVVIDLRENAGGLVASALFAVGEFFDEAVPVMVTLDRDLERMRWASLMLGSAHYGGRVAILVGSRTASGSEILAASLQEKGRAVVVGQRTAGALLTAWRSRLPDGGMLQYSRDDIITMGGQRLEGDGLEPDQVVEPATLAELRDGRDPVLETAERLLLAPPARLPQ